MNQLLRVLAWIAAGAAAGVGYRQLAKKRRQTKGTPGGLRRSGTQTIETQRLVLRRFTPDDAQAMYSNWASDPEVTRYLTWQPHKSPAQTEDTLAGWADRYEDGGYYNWAIVLKGLGEPIGNISVVEQNDRARQAHIGYCLGRKWWHQGVMSEALSAVIGYLFQEGYQRVDSRHNVANPHSGDVMKKCGMQYEATLRQSGWDNSGIHDEALYAILAQDYRGGGRP